MQRQFKSAKSRSDHSSGLVCLLVIVVSHFDWNKSLDCYWRCGGRKTIQNFVMVSCQSVGWQTSIPENRYAFQFEPWSPNSKTFKFVQKVGLPPIPKRQNGCKTAFFARFLCKTCGFPFFVFWPKRQLKKCLMLQNSSWTKPYYSNTENVFWS